MEVGVIGASYKKADLFLREKIARAAEQLKEKRVLLFLSTCNRIEIYFSGEDLPAIHREIICFFQEKGVSPSCFTSALGVDCFIHLCKVTAGLDSAILGETQIQHQVKLAYLEAKEKVHFPKPLHYFFQKALRIGKLARAKIAGLTPSFNDLLWHIAEKHPFPISRVLLVGYSETNRSFVRFLQKKGGFALSLATSFPERVAMPGVTLYSKEILHSWQTFDWLLFATRAEGYLLFGKGEKRHLIFDLSVPRNVDPMIKGVSLWNMEKINDLIDQGKSSRPSLDACEAFVQENACRLAALYQEREEGVRPAF